MKVQYNTRNYVQDMSNTTTTTTSVTILIYYNQGWGGKMSRVVGWLANQTKLKKGVSYD